MVNKRRFEEEDDKEEPGSCCHCKKSFDTLSGFLRHVSHSKLCLEDHDPALIEQMRQKSNKKSKRKWFRSNRKSPQKQETFRLYRGIKIKIGTNQNHSNKSEKCNLYASIDMRSSDAGKGFYKFFKDIYDSFEEVIKSKLEQLVQKDSEIKSWVFDDVMDLFFNKEFEETYHSLDNQNTGNADAILEKTFDILKSKFDVVYAKELKKGQDNWVTVTQFDMQVNLFHYSWHKALCNYYSDERFIEATRRAQDYAMDEIFLKLLPLEDYFEYEEGKDDDLETKLSNVYSTIFKEEFVKICYDFGFESELKTFMEKKWERKFKKFGLKYHIC